MINRMKKEAPTKYKILIRWKILLKRKEILLIWKIILKTKEITNRKMEGKSRGKKMLRGRRKILLYNMTDEKEHTTKKTEYVSKT